MSENKHFIWCDLVGHSFVTKTYRKNFGTMTIKYCVRCPLEEKYFVEDVYDYTIQNLGKCPNCGKEYSYGSFGCTVCGHDVIN